jgi:hypothetical protein
VSRPKRWSYSALSTYNECPAKYAYSYIQNLPWPSSPAMARGTLLHQIAEDYMNEPAAPVPFELKKVGRTIDGLKQKKAKAEVIWLVNRNWEPVEDQNEAWVKAIVDVHYFDDVDAVLHLHDYKSGREYPSHRGQLELYSILGLLRYPPAQRAESSAIYLDGGFSGSEGSIIRAMLPKLIEKWDGQARRMEMDDDFIANPGGACRWCPYRASAGGPCGDSAKAGL